MLPSSSLFFFFFLLSPIFNYSTSQTTETKPINKSRIVKQSSWSIELEGEPAKFPIQETRDLLKKYGISCWGTVTIMAGSRSLITSDAEARKASIEYIKEITNLSAELGGQIVTLVPGTVGNLKPSSTPENEWQWAVESIREVAKFALSKNIAIALEPLNRFETYFLNRSDQALKLADDVGLPNCGIAFDVFHMAIEERDMLGALLACGRRVFDVHVADNNRNACGDGSFDWKKIIGVLEEIDYQGALSVEFMPPIDRTPASPYKAIGGQLETGPVDHIPAHTLQFLKDHASWVLSDKYYTYMIEKSAQVLLPLIKS